MRRYIYKFIIIFLRLINPLCTDRNLCQTVYDIPADGGLIICHQQNFFAFLISSHLFKYFACKHKCIQITDLTPVDCLGYFCRCLIVTRANQRFHLVNFQFKLVFIHACHHLSKKNWNLCIIIQCKFTIGNC